MIIKVIRIANVADRKNIFYIKISGNQSGMMQIKPHTNLSYKLSEGHTYELIYENGEYVDARLIK